MKSRSKRKTVSMQKKETRRAAANPSAFQMLVNSISETRDEDILVRVLQYSQI